MSWNHFSLLLIIPNVYFCNSYYMWPARQKPTILGYKLKLCIISEWEVLLSLGYATNAVASSGSSESDKVFLEVLVKCLQIWSKCRFTRVPSSRCTTTDTGPVNLVIQPISQCGPWFENFFANTLPFLKVMNYWSCIMCQLLTKPLCSTVCVMLAWVDQIMI